MYAVQLLYNTGCSQFQGRTIAIEHNSYHTQTPLDTPGPVYFPIIESTRLIKLHVKGHYSIVKYCLLLIYKGIVTDRQKPFISIFQLIHVSASIQCALVR